MGRISRSLEDDPESLLMFHRRKPKWKQLISGLYVPPFLKFGAGYPCSPCCGCIFCIGKMPESYQAVVSGIAENGCGSCIDWNDTLILTTDDLFSGREDCSFRYTVAPAICSDSWIELWFVGGEVGGGIYGFGSALYWKADAAPSCSLTGYVLPNSAGSISGCTVAASQMIVTAL